MTTLNRRIVRGIMVDTLNPLHETEWCHAIEVNRVSHFLVRLCPASVISPPPFDHALRRRPQAAAGENVPRARHPRRLGA
jgi:hypothetical protein